MRWRQLTPRSLLFVCLCVCFSFTVQPVQLCTVADHRWMQWGRTNGAERGWWRRRKRRGRRRAHTDKQIRSSGRPHCTATELYWQLGKLSTIRSFVQTVPGKGGRLTARVPVCQCVCVCVLTANYRQSGNQVRPFSGVCCTLLFTFLTKAGPLGERGEGRHFLGYLIMCLSVFTAPS